MPNDQRISQPWVRYLSLLSLVGLVLRNDPRFAFLFAFAGFSLWGHQNRWFRALSYLGLLGFLGPVLLLLQWLTAR